MRKIIVSVHSTFNGVVTGPADDPTNFMTWAQAGIEDSKDFVKISTLSTPLCLAVIHMKTWLGNGLTQKTGQV